MRSAATRRVIGSVALFVLWGLIAQLHAQFGVGTTWVRTDAPGKGITLKVEACCKGGLRLIYDIPPRNDQLALTLTVDSPMDGTEVPTLVAGKPSGQMMAVTRVDDHHYTATVKMNGQVFSTSTGTVAPDNKTMTVETAGLAGKSTETWVRK
jgi:hypothetical protein